MSNIPVFIIFILLV